MKFALCTLAVLAAVASVSASAQALRKPGLWEVQTKNTVAGMPNMEEMMAQVPAAQRAQMEQMMKQQGMAMGGPPGSLRYCLTAERAAKEAVPASDPNMRCDNKMGKRTDTEVRFSFTCTAKDGSAITGEGRAHDITPERYAMDLDMKTMREGRPMQMRVEQKGRWLGADCQGVKPPPA
jgi:hypothetical protein